MPFEETKEYEWRPDFALARLRERIALADETRQDPGADRWSRADAHQRQMAAQDELDEGRAIDRYRLVRSDARHNAIASLQDDDYDELVEKQADQPQAVAEIGNVTLWMYNDLFFLALPDGDDDASDDDEVVVRDADDVAFPTTTEPRGPLTLERASLITDRVYRDLVLEIRNGARRERRIDAEVLVRNPAGVVIARETGADYGVPAGGRAIINLHFRTLPAPISFDIFIK